MSEFPANPAVSLTLAAGLGLLGGALFYSIWRRLLPRGLNREFWTVVPANVKAMMHSEETADLFRHYRALLAATMRYAGHNIFAALVASLPATAMFLVLEWVERGLELTFLIAAMLGSIALALWERPRRASHS